MAQGHAASDKSSAHLPEVHEPPAKVEAGAARVQCVPQDIAARKQAEEVLRRRESEFARSTTTRPS